MLDYLLEISFDSNDAQLQEELAGRLFLAGSTGNRSAEMDGTTTLTAYFDTLEERDAAGEALADMHGIVLHRYELRRVDWLDAYQQSLEAILVGERFIVAPAASLIPADTGRLSLVIPQEQGFGTGSHETTALCIELLAEVPLEGRRGLDIGSGSGILALAMVRLGAAKVVAFDNDPDAYAPLRDNRMRNGVEETVLPLFIGGLEALRGGRFDVVTMNIVPEVILPLLGAVAARLSGEGTLILSGILGERRDEVVTAASVHGLSLVDEKRRGEWWAGRFAFLS